MVLTGPREVGKTTLALEFARERNAAYIDLEDPRDRTKLEDTHKYCDRNSHRLDILDEIHRVPEGGQFANVCTHRSAPHRRCFDNGRATARKRIQHQLARLREESDCCSRQLRRESSRITVDSVSETRYRVVAQGCLTKCVQFR